MDWISSGNVAENISVFLSPLLGMVKCMMMFRMASSLKPMYNILSALSKTRNSTRLYLILPFSTKFISLPGVATKILQPRLSSLADVFKSVQLYTDGHISLDPEQNFRVSSLICMASSRVGDVIPAWSLVCSALAPTTSSL